MEMTYGGALVMPSSYAMMDEEEMMYLEGGYYINNVTIRAGVTSFIMASGYSLTYAIAALTPVTLALKAVWAKVCTWVGAMFGSGPGAVIGAVFGWLTAANVCGKIALAAITNKGIEITLNGIDIK